MKFFSSFIILGSLASITLAAPVVPRTTEADLESWIQTAIEGFFPNHDGWKDSYEATFSDKLDAKFGEKQYDKAGLKEYYTTANGAMKSVFGSPSAFSMEFTKIVAVPNANDDGGQVYVTGIEGGKLPSGDDKHATNAAYGVIAIENGEKKIVQWRESTNFKFA